MKKTIELKGVDLQSLLGAGDVNLRLIEDTFPGQIIVRGNEIHLDGVEKDINIVHDVIHEMIQTLNRKGSLTKKDVSQLINISNVENGNIQEKTENVIHYGRRGAIQSRTVGQTEYINCVRENDIVFSIGPAGTGKTYIAVAFAVAALGSHQVDRIVLSRPAVEAGENLGFLPGDLQDKIDPYLTPLYDALGDMLLQTKLKPLLAKKIIEVVPLAYMRGRTLNNAFLILDEAQNATTMQMKMFLTRLGVNSKAIITGDVTQIDLPKNVNSGLIQAAQILQNIDGIGFATLTDADVVRHQLVREIIKAYEKK